MSFMRALRALFKSGDGKGPATTEHLVVESIGGGFSYHLREKDARKSLCGQTVMPTSIPISAWGFRGELKENWCANCWKIHESNSNTGL